MRVLPASLVTSLAAVGLLAWAFATTASAGRPSNVRFPPKGERYSMGNLPQKSAEGHQHKGDGKGAHHQGGHVRHPGHGHKRPGHSSFYFGTGGLFLGPSSYYRPGYGYGPGYDYIYPYPSYPWPRYYMGPLYLPAETMYGPEAVKRFMGVDQTPAPSPAEPNVVIEPKIIVPPNRDGADANEPDAVDLRGTNRRALALAWRFIGFGDAQFADQNYADAQQRYRKATQAAPKMAEGYFRQGYAYLAMQRYELAAEAFKEGLEFDDEWPESDFANEELYGDNKLAEKSHHDALAETADQNRHDSDLFFLLGVFRYFGGEKEAAVDALEHAKRLLAENDRHIQVFLDALK